MASKYNVNLITLRFPVPARYAKMLNSISKVFNTNLVTGTVVDTMHLKMNLGTIYSYVNLTAKCSLNDKPSVIDVNALSTSMLHLRKDLVVDFRTPFSYELRWLGHSYLSLIASRVEKSLKNIGLVTAANEHMANYCKNIGAKNVQVIPNYPSKKLTATVDPTDWKRKNNLEFDDDIVLFTGGVRLREIYGLDMLLQSWKIVEDSTDSGWLVILGDDSIDTIKQIIHELQIKRVLLPGRRGSKDVANWINSAKLCLAPRTPGFSNVFYNDKDSTKISEYAALEKPVLATEYAPSNQYLLVNAAPKDFAEGILEGLDGRIPNSKAHFWEENEPLLLRSLSEFWSIEY
jgi:glycosyltransferase involved in cell wall biosynthesis